ncbi:MAG: hypothetical protein IKL60_06470 [Alistipes sp.]|nr:hypothetical protein [Alistipes sp.]
MARNSSVGNLRSCLDCSRSMGLEEDILLKEPMPRLRKERMSTALNKEKDLNNNRTIRCVRPY